jgi:ABC-type nitrate/sulfonate/bicarbonate transport system substrate-binding protein
MNWGKIAPLLFVSLTVALSGCGKSMSSTNPKDAAGTEKPEAATATISASQGPAKALTNVKVVLDWTPNTNHTGLYVAKDQGYFEQEGLNVEIIQPGDGGPESVIASGAAEFGVSVQENITTARLQNVPIVSIAAIIQHNTSGFASPVAKNIKSPKDFEGKTYGGYGAPSEKAVIDSLMQTEKADVNKVNMINIGEADYFTAVKRDIDFSWIYYAWTGVDAELRNEPLNMIYLTQYSDKLDYYTPVLATSEKMIKEKPEIVKAFTAAASKGYQFAIDKPEEAANILLKAAPDLDKKLVVASQKWLSPRYKDDAPRWGEQKRTVWDNYATWMLDHKLLEKKLDVDAAFTNDFLPSLK